MHANWSLTNGTSIVIEMGCHWLLKTEGDVCIWWTDIDWVNGVLKAHVPETWRDAPLWGKISLFACSLREQLAK